MPVTQLHLPTATSHKGQNGKLLIVGGSHLFHAASLWSASVAAYLVDMVFYASTKENNQLVKSIFTDGIVIERTGLLDYAQEADVILVGPGLQRIEKNIDKLHEIFAFDKNLSTDELENDSYLLTNWLLRRFPEKKFVLDAGALQMLELDLVTPTCILTPHQGELQILRRNREPAIVEKLAAATILSKNIVDEVEKNGQVLAQIVGGNEGLTKGGSGDVLAGVVAALYCYNDSVTACEWASLAVNRAADTLYEQAGPFYTTTQLVATVPPTLWKLIHD